MTRELSTAEQEAMDQINASVTFPRGMVVELKQAREPGWIGLVELTAGQPFISVSFPLSLSRNELVIPLERIPGSAEDASELCRLITDARNALVAHTSFVYQFLAARVMGEVQLDAEPAVMLAADIANQARIGLDVPEGIGIDLKVGITGGTCQCPRCKERGTSASEGYPGDVMLEVWHKSDPEKVWSKLFRFQSVTEIAKYPLAHMIPDPEGLMRQAVQEAKNLRDEVHTMALAAEQSALHTN